VLGVPFTVPLDLAGLPAATRDGRLRSAVSRLIATARQHGARAIVIEDLDFTAARTEGRERHGNRPSRGKRGRAFRRMVSGIPTGRLRDRLVQMTANAGLHVIVADPAYTSRWGAEHWLASLREHHAQATGHHAAALVLGRRGLGHRAGRRANGNRAAPETRHGQPRRGPGNRPQPAPHPGNPPPHETPGSHRHQDRQASPDHGRQPGSPRPFGAAR
jgi:IS605 OrfB family transposase